MSGDLETHRKNNVGAETTYMEEMYKFAHLITLLNLQVSTFWILSGFEKWWFSTVWEGILMLFDIVEIGKVDSGTI